MSSYAIPYVTTQTSRGERTVDIYSRLLADRIVYLGTGIDDGVANAIIAQLLHLDAVQPFGQRFQHTTPVRRELCQRGYHLQQARAIAVGQRIEHRRHLGAVHGTQHGAHHVLTQRAAGIGDRLVQQ